MWVLGWMRDVDVKYSNREQVGVCGRDLYMYLR